MNEENLCGECTNCCQGTIVRAKETDVQRWKKEQRYDIILCLETWMGANAYLIHKKNKDECIFLTTTGCEIYSTRPEVCKDFPVSKRQVEKYECKLTPKKH